MSNQNENFKLKKKLKMAGINKTPSEYTSQVLKSSSFIGIAMTLFSCVLATKLGFPIFFGLAIGMVFFLIVYSTLIRSVDSKIQKRAKEIDRDVLFAGRFLLIKLNSGKPLIMSLIEASQSYGVASHYFKDLVRNIELGTPLEQALEEAMDYCPSAKMKKILFYLNAALKAGVDPTRNLEAILDEITHDQLLEIQRYGKKLSSLTLFYMLGAIVIPSLGMTLFIIVASLVSLSINAGIFVSFVVFLLIIEVIFLTIFQSIRPSVNI